MTPQTGDVFISRITVFDQPHRFHYLFRFNAFEFDSPFKQAIFEARNWCLNNRHLFHGITMMPYSLWVKINRKK